MAHITDVRAAAARLFSDAQTIHGFTVEHHEPIAELDADAYVLRHTISGARLLYLPCDDENKAFAIAFKTPPQDDTGVFHILEHSVLCGSTKFPVKEPFVDLIKSSMQTFLNAMTYPDKTVYPVATTNEQDLYNLMDVYMDAVLNPAIYEKPTIFQQEGWHYELDVPAGEDGTPEPFRAGTLCYNGVVFNEMKGALSDPESVLDDAINVALFPDTAYARESGGDPRAIPTLTYEKFLDTHARHYNLANSYITLYGDMDIDRALAWLDERYLTKPNAASLRMEEACAAGVDVRNLAPNPLEKQAPVVCDYKRVQMCTTPENAMVGMAYVLGDALDRTQTIAADILFEALLGSNEAPLKKAILDANLGDNVVSYTNAEGLQPYEMLILKGVKTDDARAFRTLIEEECHRLIEEGIPRDRLEAIISSNEYDLRQRDQGVADGVGIACDALSTWLYDDNAATLALKYGPVYEELRQKLESTYFEDLLQKLVLESTHCALVELAPIEANATDNAEAAELETKKDALSDEELQAIVNATAALRAAQEAEDTPEAKATLPRLHVADIGEARTEPPLALDTETPLPCLKHNLPTNHLAYALTYFDLSCVEFEELPYVSILTRLLKKLPTQRHSASELDSYIGGNLGFLAFGLENFNKVDDPRAVQPMLLVAAGALSEKIEHLARVPREIWSETLFDDTERIHNVLKQIRLNQEQTFLMAGHSAALARALSYTSPSAVVGQKASGVDFYLFLRDLLDHFDERKDDLCAKLSELSKRIFCSTGAVASFTGTDEDYARYWGSAGDLGLCERESDAHALVIPEPAAKREAFIIPSDICFAAQAADPRLLGIDVTGAWSVASNALSYDYLWNEIRVKGGAYGCGFRTGKSLACFYTYRDPAIDPSLERIARAGAWLSSFEPDTSAFEGFIVSCVSGIDAPIKPYALTKRRNSAYFTGAGLEERLRRRSEILATTPAELRALGAQVGRIASEAPVCVFGGREAIEASDAGLTTVDLFAQ